MEVKVLSAAVSAALVAICPTPGPKVSVWAAFDPTWTVTLPVRPASVALKLALVVPLVPSAAPMLPATVSDPFELSWMSPPGAAVDVMSLCTLEAALVSADWRSATVANVPFAAAAVREGRGEGRATGAELVGQRVAVVQVAEAGRREGRGRLHRRDDAGDRARHRRGAGDAGRADPDRRAAGDLRIVHGAGRRLLGLRGQRLRR